VATKPKPERRATRLRILGGLRERPYRFWTLDELAAAHHIDRSVAFEHVETLVAADLASKHKISRHRGRPANAYRYRLDEAARVQPAQRSQLLATLLARSLTVAPGGAGLAYTTGRELGLRIGDLDRLDGDYVVREHQVRARTCMFGAACPSAPDIVCAVHAGLIEGALSGLHPRGAVVALGPDGLGGCTFRLEGAAT
jgi:hypothetical protein